MIGTTSKKFKVCLDDSYGSETERDVQQADYEAFLVKRNALREQNSIKLPSEAHLPGDVPNILSSWFRSSRKDHQNVHTIVCCCPHCKDIEMVQLYRADWSAGLLFVFFDIVDA